MKMLQTIKSDKFRYRVHGMAGVFAIMMNGALMARVVKGGDDLMVYAIPLTISLFVYWITDSE